MKCEILIRLILTLPVKNVESTACSTTVLEHFESFSVKSPKKRYQQSVGFLQRRTLVMRGAPMGKKGVPMGKKNFMRSNKIENLIKMSKVDFEKQIFEQKFFFRNFSNFLDFSSEVP